MQQLILFDSSEILATAPHVCHRNFIKVPRTESVYQSEEWKCKQTTLYQPLTQDIMINMARVEQLSFASGTYFIADESGQYCGSKEGEMRSSTLRQKDLYYIEMTWSSTLLPPD
jgi:hypothetical protein